jgi:putative methyltransferase (TIGR04325 family)
MKPSTEKAVHRALHDITPPIVARLAKRFGVLGQDAEYEYVGSAWPKSHARGWDVESVVARQLADWSDLTRRAGGADVLTANGLVAHNTLMSFAYVLGRAASGRSTLSLLDWGGGLGQYGVIARALYPGIGIRYSCRDLRLMTETGRELLPDAVFYDNDDDAFAGRHDLVMASSSLHYVEDWSTTLTHLAEAADRYLFVTRQPFVVNVPSFVVVQRPIAYGYDTEYPGWVLNRKEFLESVTQTGLGLVREFITGEEPFVPQAPEPPVYRGFLFERPGT